VKNITRTIRDELPPDALDEDGNVRRSGLEGLLRSCMLGALTILGLALFGAFSIGWWAHG